MKKVKFKLETKKGQKVYRINLNILNGTSTCSLHKEGLFVEELKIVHQTEYKIALNDKWISLLDRCRLDERKASYKRYLDEITVSIKTTETYFPNGIFCECYTIGNTENMIKRMKHEIINKIKKEYGFLSDSSTERKIYDMEVSL